MHEHFVQYFVFTLPPSTVSAQQSPASYQHPALLFSSSQLPSPWYSGTPHFGAAGPWLSGSTHAHFVQYFLETWPPDTVLGQQSPPSYAHPLLLSSSQLPSPLYCAIPHVFTGPAGPWLSGSTHAHFVQYFLETWPPDTVLGQQSPPSYAHPLLLFSSSQ